MLDCLPTGPRLGRIRGDLDRAHLELTAMQTETAQQDSAARSPLIRAMGTAMVDIRRALANLDTALAEVNRGVLGPILD